MFAQHLHRRQRLERRHISGACQNDVGTIVAIVAGPFPHADPCFAMLNRRLHVQPLCFRMLAGHNYVDLVPAAQAMVGDGQQRVGIGRQVDPDDLGLLVEHMVDEARILVAGAIVVLAPDMR